MKWRETRRGQLATEASKLSSKGNHSDALNLLERALELKPKDPLVLVYRGRVLHALARYGEAEKSFRDALNIDGNLCYAWNELGLLFEDRGFFEKAADCLTRSVQLRPDFNSYTVLAKVELMFDVDAALSDAEKALELNPGWDEAIQVRDAAKERGAQVRGAGDSQVKDKGPKAQ